MKLSNEILAVIKNFSGINQGIEFKKGNVLSTISAGKTVLAQAKFKEEFPEDFCIYDLNKFLQVHSFFKDGPELNVKGGDVIFEGKNGKFSYRTTAKSMIVTPPDKELKLGSIDLSFTLTDAVYADLMKAVATIGAPNISIVSDGDKITLVAFDAKDDSQNTFTLEVGEGNGKVYNIVFKTENIKMVPGNYEVQISFKGLSHFKNTNGLIQYWVAFEAKESKF